MNAAKYGPELLSNERIDEDRLATKFALVDGDAALLKIRAIEFERKRKLLHHASREETGGRAAKRIHGAYESSCPCYTYLCTSSVPEDDVPGTSRPTTPAPTARSITTPPSSAHPIARPRSATLRITPPPRAAEDDATINWRISFPDGGEIVTQASRPLKGCATPDHSMVQRKVEWYNEEAGEYQEVPMGFKAPYLEY
jgi:hypothetical protein